jgi:hypothetical protein
MTAFQDLLCELAQSRVPRTVNIGSEKRARANKSDQLPVCRPTGSNPDRNMRIGNDKSASGKSVNGLLFYSSAWELVPLPVVDGSWRFIDVLPLRDTIPQKAVEI